MKNKKLKVGARVHTGWGMGRVVEHVKYDRLWSVRLDQPTWVFGSYTVRCADYAHNLEVVEE